MIENTDLQDLKFDNPEYDIEESDWSSDSFDGKGNLGKPDTPGLSAEMMQKVMDQLPRFIAARINEIVDLISETEDGASGADQIGATPIPGGTATTVQGILDEIGAGIGGGVRVLTGTAAPTSSQGSDGDIYVQYVT